ncbi:urease accessory protein [Mycolicibacterium agri]|uniref:Urease accessory protein n=1 Tax=Mycolicibacterium agri TaxID=36811 RepID=A0A2A7MXL9_MYCAG|nr:urease accessory protein UreD [Mycolicibacterium agri]PEG36263.1 urease accessory protein [Mycolicibacterium agri]GFG48793.1 urease accessory protein [Mycolicibacterium agri]
MHSDVLIVARAGLWPRLECAGGIAARATETDTIHLVSTAATPLGGDTIVVRVVVEPGARLRVRTAAATVALPGRGTAESTAHWHLEVAGTLDVDTEPTVVAGGSRHTSSTRLSITGAGRVRLRERVQIGRTDERQGFWSGILHADVDGAALLRHRVELGDGTVAHDELGAPLACVSELRYPDAHADAPGCVLELAHGGCLATWQGDRLGAA